MMGLLKLVQPPARRLLWLTICIVIPTILACAFVGDAARPITNRVVIQNRLSTLTPTAGLSPQMLQTPVELTAASATPIPQPAFTPMGNAASASVNHENINTPMLTALVDINVRAGPGLEYTIIGQLTQGQISSVTGKNPEGTWWQIMYPAGSNGLGWVSANPQYTTVSQTEVVAIAQVPALPTPIITPINVPTLLPTLTATVISQPTPNTSGWSFASIRADTSQEEDNLLLYGNVINTSNSTQEVGFVTGIFYDTQGQVIADEQNTYDYWVAKFVPPGGQMPFELTVSGIQNAANLNLRVQSEPSNATPRQDFDFLDVTASNEAGDYCLSGRLRNSADELEEYLIFVAVLYDGQNQVINFGEYDEPNFEEIIGEQTLDFEICIDPMGQGVKHYELQAWGL